MAHYNAVAGRRCKAILKKLAPISEYDVEEMCSLIYAIGREPSPRPSPCEGEGVAAVRGIPGPLHLPLNSFTAQVSSAGADLRGIHPSPQRHRRYQECKDHDRREPSVRAGYEQCVEHDDPEDKDLHRAADVLWARRANCR